MSYKFNEIPIEEECITADAAILVEMEARIQTTVAEFYERLQKIAANFTTKQNMMSDSLKFHSTYIRDITTAAKTQQANSKHMQTKIDKMESKMMNKKVYILVLAMILFVLALVFWAIYFGFVQNADRKIAPDEPYDVHTIKNLLNSTILQLQKLEIEVGDLKSNVSKFENRGLEATLEKSSLDLNIDVSSRKSEINYTEETFDTASTQGTYHN